MTKPTIDRARIEDATGGDEEILRELVDIYLEDADLRLQELRAALTSADDDKFGKTAHKLKGSSANMGAMNVYDYAKELEHLGRDKRLDGAADILSTLEAEMERVRQVLVGMVA